MDQENNSTPYTTYLCIALFMIVGSYASFLSWGINGLLETPTMMKVLYALAAYFGNAGYLAYYYIAYIKSATRLSLLNENAAYARIGQVQPNADLAKRLST